MPRQPRKDIKDVVYHIINRSNARISIFNEQGDYELFEKTLSEAVEKFK